MNYLYFGVFPVPNDPDIVRVQVSFQNHDGIICIPFDASSVITCGNGWLVITKPDGKQIIFHKAP